MTMLVCQHQDVIIVYDTIRYRTCPLCDLTKETLKLTNELAKLTEDYDKLETELAEAGLLATKRKPSCKCGTQRKTE